jgi:MoaA/NifB/PqqE/SkfB family radical SAM enzyme
MVVIRTRGDIYEGILAEFRSKNYKGTDLTSKWVSLDEYNKLKNKFTIKQVCKKCGGKTYCLGCDGKRFFAPRGFPYSCEVCGRVFSKDEGICFCGEQ